MIAIRSSQKSDRRCGLCNRRRIRTLIKHRIDADKNTYEKVHIGEMCLDCDMYGA